MQTPTLKFFIPAHADLVSCVKRGQVFKLNCYHIINFGQYTRIVMELEQI
jgi:hypothetical protein